MSKAPKKHRLLPAVTTAIVAQALFPALGWCAWLIGSPTEEGVEASPNYSFEERAHQRGRGYLPLHSREWRDLKPEFRQHVLAVWREMAQRGQQPLFNDGARTTEDSISLAAECSSAGGRCAHQPAIGSGARHEQGLAVDMQPAGFRTSWEVFFDYYQILDANDLYLPLGGADLPHVEQQPLQSGQNRLTIVDMFNAVEGNPAGTLLPWSRQYMVRQTAAAHWKAASSASARQAWSLARAQMVARAAERAKSAREQRQRSQREVEREANISINKSHAGKTYVPGGWVNEHFTPGEWMTDDEIREALDAEDHNKR